MNSEITLSLTRPLLFFAVTICLVFGTPAGADEPQYLPGELPITLGRELVGSDRVPTLLEIEEAVAKPEVGALMLFRLHQDSNNHYAPAWSRDGQSLAYLQADIDQRTCKVLVLRKLHGISPETIYGDSGTYEHMPAWGPGRRLVFASNHGDDREENIHLWQPDSDPEVLTSGGGAKALPQLQQGGAGAQMLYRRTDHFELLNWSWRRAGQQRERNLGLADEMRLSPDGAKLAVIRSSGSLGQGQELAVRQLNSQSDTRLPVPEGHLLRNVVWSPDGRWLAFWARPLNGFEWGMWTCGESGNPRPSELQGGVRVQEDFRHVSPAWSSDSRRLWFTLSRGEQSYYPLQWIHPDGTGQGQVDYSKELTTALDVAVCPAPSSAALSFVAVSRRSLEVYVMLLNHL